MQSRWSDAEAQEFVKRYAAKGVNEDLALRTYTTRLLGSDPKLVLHGGGNTSVKTMAKDLLGDEVEVLCVKGSGWDMGAIEPAGLPAVRLAPLRRLRALDKLSDEDMVNFQRINLLDSTAPNPSVETLLHAFLPHKFIDHTHSTAVLALTDQPDGEAMVREVYGDRVAYVPYTIPGFALAKVGGRCVRQESQGRRAWCCCSTASSPSARRAEQAYERMIEFVTHGGRAAADGSARRWRRRRCPAKLASVPEIAPILRGAVAIEKNAMAGTAKRQILGFRTESGDPGLCERRGAVALLAAGRGDARPHHPHQELAADRARAGSRQAGRMGGRSARRGRQLSWRAITTISPATTKRARSKKKELDPLPRVILVPGVGLFGLGASAKDAAIAADIAENTIEVIADAEAIGEYQLHQRIRHVRGGILVAGTGQAGQGRTRRSWRGRWR